LFGTINQINKGKRCSIYFPNYTIYKRDTALFEPIFKTFTEDQIRYHWKQNKDETPFNKEDFKEGSNRFLIFDEFDSIFFESKQNMALLSTTSSCGVTATSHRKGGVENRA